MIVGMSTVFAFLCFMIWFLKAQGWLLTRFFPQAKHTTTAVADLKISDATLTKVVLAAIDEYKKKR
jgi:Na+-transporting methylmalonyl-CoA/oxaloacetate decarboxylase gamma subunit